MAAGTRQATTAEMDAWSKYLGRVPLSPAETEAVQRCFNELGWSKSPRGPGGGGPPIPGGPPR